MWLPENRPSMRENLLPCSWSIVMHHLMNRGDWRSVDWETWWRCWADSRLPNDWWRPCRSPMRRYRWWAYATNNWRGDSWTLPERWEQPPHRQQMKLNHLLSTSYHRRNNSYLRKATTRDNRTIVCTWRVDKLMPNTCNIFSIWL